MMDIFSQILDFLFDFADAHKYGQWILFIFFLLLGLLYKLAPFAKLFEKLIDSDRIKGMPFVLSREEKHRIRIRSQFCHTIEADLAQLAKYENWNDQWFTDLEAEVESEGGYYASRFHKWLKRPSFGLRREKSLIKAISNSTERAVQLVGEPGAGKSVAMRHLALQLAQKGRNLKLPDAKIPLYINLREMSVRSQGEAISADSIKEFVLDNIRRGDSDTTAYVKENWDLYRENGTWIFLFDSFDEIPAVLHAEYGSTVTREYSEAIRQFLEGMGECKGILASREFKGPEALAWNKFRILPLNEDKQAELVSNALLTSTQESTVLQHIGHSSVLASTPLFLSLLCRYVKENNNAPSHDYDLLSNHINKLADKDRDYIQRKYKLTPDDLLGGQNTSPNFLLNRLAWD